jgi:hypothetical protein
MYISSGVTFMTSYVVTDLAQNTSHFYVEVDTDKMPAVWHRCYVRIDSVRMTDATVRNSII